MINFTLNGKQLYGDFPLLWGRRQWMLGTTDRDRSLLNVTKDPNVEDRQSSPLPQLLLIKHGDFPLDLVKDYQLEWADNQSKHPHMIMRSADVEALAMELMSRPAPDHRQARFGQAPVYLDESMSRAIRAYLITGDAELGRHLCATAARAVQSVVDGYLKQSYLPTPGFRRRCGSRRRCVCSSPMR